MNELPRFNISEVEITNNTTFDRRPAMVQHPEGYWMKADEVLLYIGRLEAKIKELDDSLDWASGGYPR